MNSGVHVGTLLTPPDTGGFLYITHCNSLTFGSGLSLMRKRFLLKLSLRTFDQLKALIFECPWRDEKKPLRQYHVDKLLHQPS